MSRLSAATGDTVVLRLPLTLKKKGGAKMVLVPPPPLTPSTPVTFPPARQHSIHYPLLQALVRAQGWKRQLDRGRYAHLREIARAEGRSWQYVSRIYQLNYLAPRLKVAILEGTQPRHLTLTEVYEQRSVSWFEQQQRLGMQLIEG